MPLNEFKSLKWKLSGNEVEFSLISNGFKMDFKVILVRFEAISARFAVDIVRCEPMPSLAPPPAAPTNLRIFTRCALTGAA